THPLKAQRQALLKRERRFHTITPVPIPQTQAHRDAPIATHAETQEYLVEIIATVFAMAIGRPGRPWRLRFILIRSIERNGRGVLMPPGCGDGVDLQRLEGNRTKHLVEIGRKKRIEHLPQAVIVECSTREPRLQQCQHAPLFEALPHLGEGVMTIENSEDQSFDPTTTQEPMCRVRGDETVNHRATLQAPKDS